MDYSEIFRERYSTALIADAAYRAGVRVGVPQAGLLPLDFHSKLAGTAVTIEANNDLVAILGALHAAASGDVLVIANQHNESGLIGDLAATEARRKGLAGVVVDGLVRDVAEIVGMGLPVFSRGRIPVGPLKLPAAMKGIGEIGVALRLGEVEVRPGDWLFGDADGVIVLEADDLPDVFERAAQAAEREQVIVDAIRAGESLGDLLDIDGFLRKRESDSKADFNQHLSDLGRAI